MAERVTIKQTRAINFMQRGCLSVENANGSLLEASLIKGLDRTRAGSESPLYIEAHVLPRHLPDAPIPPPGGPEVRGPPPRTPLTAPPRHPAAAREAALPPGPPHPATRRPRGRRPSPPDPPARRHFATRRPGGRRPFPPDPPHRPPLHKAAGREAALSPRPPDSATQQPVGRRQNSGSTL